MTRPSDEVVGFYRRHARSWAGEGTRQLFERSWLERFRSLLPQDGAVLDLGCGAGQPIARWFVEEGCRVTGVDSSPEMISMCEANFPHGDWRMTDMRTLALGARFDGILAWDSFFHLNPDDQRAIFDVFRRHAAPKAALMFTSGPARGEAVGELYGEPLYHASLNPTEYRALQDAQGFDVIAHVVEDPDCGQHTIWLARLR